MGCRIFAILGGLVGLFFLYTAMGGLGAPQGWAAIVGLIIILICVIPWIAWMVEKAKQQQEIEYQQATPLKQQQTIQPVSGGIKYTIISTTTDQAPPIQQPQPQIQPQLQSQPQQQPERQSTSGGVLFVPLPLDEQNRPREG